MWEKSKYTSFYFCVVIFILLASSWRMAMIVPRTENALGSLDGLTSTGVIDVPLTSPKSSNLLLLFP